MKRPVTGDVHRGQDRRCGETATAQSAVHSREQRVLRIGSRTGRVRRVIGAKVPRIDQFDPGIGEVIRIAGR